MTAVDGVPTARFRSDKIRALPAYQAVEADRPHRREMLANLLWSDWSRRDSLRNLRKSLHRLRQTLGEETADSLLTISQQSVQINAGHLQLDVHQLQQAKQSDLLFKQGHVEASSIAAFNKITP